MRRENEKKGGGFSLPLLADQAAFHLKQSQDWKSNNMIYLGLLPEFVRVCAKKQETVSEMFERQGAVPAFIHEVTWDVGEELLNDWHDLLPLSIRVRKFTWYALPFYPVPEKQHFSMVESVQGLCNIAKQRLALNAATGLTEFAWQQAMGNTFVITHFGHDPLSLRSNGTHKEGYPGLLIFWIDHTKMQHWDMAKSCSKWKTLSSGGEVQTMSHLLAIWFIFPLNLDSFQAP